MRACALVWTLAGSLLGCATQHVGQRAGLAADAAQALTCPTDVSAVLPSWAEDRVLIDTQRLFAHPRLPRLLARTLDQASARALVTRAEQFGYEVRTLERVAIAMTARHTTLYVAQGPMDTGRIVQHLYDRLREPRRLHQDAAQRTRVEGRLGPTLSTLVTAPTCRMVAYTEGPEGTLADRLNAPTAASPESPTSAPSPSELSEPMLHWHSTQRFVGVSPSSDALMSQVRAMDLRVEPTAEGLVLELTLLGALAADAETRLRRAVRELADTPMGVLSAAAHWTAPERLSIVRETDGTTRLRTVAPWEAVEALAEGLGGHP